VGSPSFSSPAEIDAGPGSVCHPLTLHSAGRVIHHSADTQSPSQRMHVDVALYDGARVDCSTGFHDSVHPPPPEETECTCPLPPSRSSLSSGNRTSESSCRESCSPCDETRGECDERRGPCRESCGGCGETGGPCDESRRQAVNPVALFTQIRYSHSAEIVVCSVL
jgi:hypothetical protein